MLSKINLNESFLKTINTFMLQDALSNISDPLFDELDWPQLGFGIGFMNSSYPVLVKVYDIII